MSKSDLLTIELQSLENNRTVIDVLCVTEHNMINDDAHLLKLINYSKGSFYCRKTRHGGTCILVRNSHKYKSIVDLSKHCREGIIECSGIELIEHKLMIICVYRPPKQNMEALKIFFQAMSSMLSKVCLGRKKVVICGDFNINILDKTRTVNELRQLMSSFNLQFAINVPTRLSSGTCIDNFLYNQRGCIGSVLDLALSDHTAQLLVCPVKPTCLLKYWYIERRDYSHENINKFRESLSALSFSDSFKEDDPNNSFNSFYETFILFYNLCFPLRKIKITTQKRPKWLSHGIKICCKRKRALLWAYRKQRTVHNKNNYKTLSSRLTRIIKLTQKSQNDNFIRNASNKAKATWDVINGHKNNVPKNDIQINIDGNLIDDPLVIANLFNNFFIDQISKLDLSPNSANSTIHVKSLFMAPTIPQDINKIIMSLKNTNSTGYDGISTKILKTVSCNISPVLSHIMNLCIFNGVFPEKLKLTVIKPIFKKDDKYDMNCYRPIALIPILSKVFEKVIHNSIYNYFERNNLFTEEQVGFRKNKTINLAIYNFLSTVMTSIDNKIPACALYMDLSKAFDFVDHTLLLEKLYCYGIRGNVHSLIESYLTKRKQATQICKICPKLKHEVTFTSEYKTVQFGVPQGSVLGPLLFIIYINDLPRITGHPTILFADDSTVLFTDKNPSSMEQDILGTLDNIIQWLTSNNLKINLQKTNLMIFRNRVNSLNYFDINYSQHKIKHVDTTKFLGLDIDCNLNWKKHAEGLCLKVSQYSYALYMLAKVASTSTVVTAYHGYVASTLRYGIMFWGNSTERETVFKAQKKCIRAICKLKPTESCKQHFKDLKLLTLPSLYIYEVVIFVRHNLTLFENFKSKRYNYKLKYPNNRTTLFNKSIMCMAPRIYNHLPKTIVDIQATNIFKFKVKCFLLDKIYYSVNDYLSDKF